MKAGMKGALIVLALTGLTSFAEAEPANDPTAQAKIHFRQRTALFDLGKYLEAAAEYELAFKLTERPGLLFNIGQAYRLAGKSREALSAYQGFVRRLPDAPQRPEAEGQIEALRRKIGEDEARASEDAARRDAEARRQADERAAAEKAAAEKALADATLSASKPMPKPVYKRWWLWTIVGVVVVGGAVGAGLALGLSAKEKRPYELPPLRYGN